MRVLGVDPGSICAGYAVIECADPHPKQIKIISSGSIQLDEQAPLGMRLLQLAEDLESIIRRHRPTELALESIFFAKNPKSSIQLGQSRGICLYLGAKYGLELAEYSPTEVKASLGATGRATKEQIQHMIRILLRLPRDYKFVSHDHSDALAIALSHVHAKQSFTGRLLKDDRTTAGKSRFSKSPQLRD